MFEIGIPNFIKTSEYKSDPLKYNYFRTYNRGKYTLLVSHNGEFFSFLDIASTLKKFNILSLFMIISKKDDEYTFLIGNSFYPYEKTLVNKSIVKKDQNFKSQLQKTKQFIEMIRRMLNTKNIIIFPIDIDEKEIKELIGENIEYKLMDITKYLLLTPVTQPVEKLAKPFIISILIAGISYFLYGYIDDYFKYTYKPKIEMKIRKEKSKLRKEKNIYQSILNKNKELKSFLSNKSKMKIYEGKDER